MDKKLKPWKYGLIGIAGAILGFSFMAYVFNQFVPLFLVLLGYIGGSIGGRRIKNQKGAIFAALFVGLIFPALGVGVFFLLASPFLLNHPHMPPQWLIPSTVIVYMVAVGYQIIKDFRNGK